MAQVKEFDPSIVPHLLNPFLLEPSPPNHYWVDYDEETDTLYISFRKPQNADDSITEDDLIFHVSGNELVGVTILNAKSH